ncbi:hypothetical protein [Enterobacter cancerogenus]|uniref:hypothetical protein n=1 Tax=Enterobacter cancerogenus TaxID=69218 RepID=UPI0022391E27|nr:hypothetical protein [Enterobacter cancerogenus]
MPVVAANIRPVYKLPGVAPQLPCNPPYSAVWSAFQMQAAFVYRQAGGEYQGGPLQNQRVGGRPHHGPVGIPSGRCTTDGLHGGEPVRPVQDLLLYPG